MLRKKATYFDDSWQELKNVKGGKYKSQVISLVDSIYNLSYFDDKEDLLYEIPYSSLNPLKKTGTMSIYNKDFIESKRVYSNDSLQEVSYFHNNGAIQFVSLNKLKKLDYGDDFIENNIIGLYDNKGLDLLIEDKIISFDYGNQKVYHQIKDRKIENSYVNENGKKVYFFKKKKWDISTYKFKNNLKYYLYERISFRKVRLNKNIEGTKLLEITTIHKGIVTNYIFLNSLNNELDILLEEYLKSSFIGKFKFKGIKLEDKEGLCRFILPVNFSHKRTYRTFSRPDNNFLIHEMMFQQQMQWQNQ